MRSADRRQFLKSGAAASLGAWTLRPSLAAVAAPKPSPLQLRPLSYSQVQLLDGPMQVQFEHNHALFLALDDDRLLKPFRQAAGMDAPGEDMGGWYSPSKDFNPPGNMTGYIPGHSFGQYLSGLARAYAVTGDPATQRKVQRLVKSFAATLSPKFYAGYNLPCYTFDKTVCGLLDAHEYADDPLALAVLNYATDVALPYLPDHALTRKEMDARPHPNVSFTWDEPYTLPENLYLAYSRGAGTRFRAMAQRYLQDSTYFEPLADGNNVLPGQHAYSHVNALCSAMQSYFVDGSGMHLAAARNGFRFVSEQSYATGGWGPNEGFQKPDTDDLANTLDHTHASFETPCGAYGQFKLSRYLLFATGDSSYGDSMEMILYNTILGAKLIQPDGTSFYYSDFGNNATKVSYEQKWPCCSGTFPQLTADYGISSYFATPKGIAVNLYTPSRVAWLQGGAQVSLTQATVYPADGNTTLTVATDHNTRFTLSLRIPAWAGAATRVSVNGRPGTARKPQAGGWHTIDREWRNGDRVELTLDMPLRLIPLDAGHPSLVALAAGPLALFAVLPAPEHFTKAQLLAASQDHQRSLAWSIPTDEGSSRALPYMAIDRERYRLYHQTA